MLNGVHLLLTYKCDGECDHCFVFAGPQAKGTFALERLRDAIRQAACVATVRGIYLEGGEPFLFYPIMIEGVRTARRLGLTAGIVTNAYWATSAQDAEAWLTPLVDAGLTDLSVSDDALHHGEEGGTRGRNASAPAERLGLHVTLMPTQEPSVGKGEDGRPVVVGVMFRGRAVEKLAAGMPVRAPEGLRECPHENLREPGRVHVDAYGNVHLCQGLLMGNLWRKPLDRLVADFDPDGHPVCGPLLRGGPAALAEAHGLERAAGYVDACHLCYEARKALLGRFPDCLGPPQVYGL